MCEQAYLHTSEDSIQVVSVEQLVGDEQNISSMDSIVVGIGGVISILRSTDTRKLDIACVYS